MFYEGSYNDCPFYIIGNSVDFHMWNNLYYHIDKMYNWIIMDSCLRKLS